MTTNIDAVIAALEAALAEADRSREVYWKVSAANLWTDQLTGSLPGNRHSLRLQGSHTGHVERHEFIAHVKATIAYLKATRTSLRTEQGRSANPHSVPGAGEPIDADFEDVQPAKPGGFLRLPNFSRLFK